MKRILIVGATSTIAAACARAWSTEGARFFLVARDAVRVKQLADDLLVRGAKEAHVHILDVTQTAGLRAMFDRCYESLRGVDVALLAHGILSDQEACQLDVDATLLEFATNASSVAALLTILSGRMAASGSGTIAVISSVAGDRGRASNYTYGATKAAVTAYCEGLRARMYSKGVHVLTIKPGPVATPMTAGTNIPSFLVAAPERVAQDIVKAVEGRVSTLYTPWFWRPIMAIIRALPEPILRRLPV
jgi:decaprenylphospho-beta-D-erythro-pentofuranosid-2-ulose 2-reductase